MMTVCRFSSLVMLVVELSWLDAGYGLHREGGSRVMKQWEGKVRSASSLDELLSLAGFPDWKLWRCRLRPPRAETPYPTPPPPAGSHRSTRYAAEPYDLEILKAIDEEWQRTQCMPRETCVDVAKELGTDPSMFFKPPCVSVHRCGGCRNQEGVTCRNTTTALVNKTVLSVTPFRFVPEPVLIKVANHTECRCMEPAIIRRDAQPRRAGGCSPIGRLMADSRRLCAGGLIWDCSTERCIPYPSGHQEFPLGSRMPDCEVDVERCDCLPGPGAAPDPGPGPVPAPPRPARRCELNSSLCAHRHQRFDHATCRCRKPK